MAHKWTKEHYQFILDHVYEISNKELTEKFNQHFKLNLTIGQIKAYKKNNGISSGLDGRFKKGRIPFNKGLKWNEYLTKEQQEKSWRTTFKKGDIPTSHLPVGSEVERNDGYLYVKIAEPRSWKQKHRIIWEAKNGPVPKKHKIVFLDGDKRNFSLENLILVTDNDLLTMNRSKLIYKDPELTKAGVLISKLINKTYEKEKTNNENPKSDN